MPSISTCIISRLTALQRDCLICVNSIPQPCRTLQRSKCQDGGMRKIKEWAYAGSNGGGRQEESLMSMSFQLLNKDTPTQEHTQLSFLDVWLVTMREVGDGAGSSHPWVWASVRENCFSHVTVKALIRVGALYEHTYHIQFVHVFNYLYLCPLFLHLPLSTHVLLLNRHTGHLAQPDAHLNVSEVQTQVLPQDGHPGSPLARPRLREQLEFAKKRQKSSYYIYYFDQWLPNHFHIKQTYYTHHR